MAFNVLHRTNHLHQPGGLNLGKSSPILFQPNRGRPARIQPQKQTWTTNSLSAEDSQRQPAVQQRDKAVVADPQWQQKYFPTPPPGSLRPKYQGIHHFIACGLMISPIIACQNVIANIERISEKQFQHPPSLNLCVLTRYLTQFG